MYIYFYIFVSVFIQLKTMSSHQYFQFQSNIPGFVLVFSLSVIVTPFSDNDKPHSHYPYIWTYLTHPSVCDQPPTTATLFLCSCHPHSSSAPVLPAKLPSYAEIFLTFLKLWYPALSCPPTETFLSPTWIPKPMPSCPLSPCFDTFLTFFRLMMYSVLGSPPVWCPPCPLVLCHLFILTLFWLCFPYTRGALIFLLGPWQLMLNCNVHIKIKLFLNT